MKIRDCVFTFGSNTAGRHGKGAAFTARELFNARFGVGAGHEGMSYAIPTKDDNLKTIPLPIIKLHVGMFLDYEKTRHFSKFLVTRIGTGLAGYSDEQISLMFQNAPSNCILPAIWNIDNGNISHHIESITADDLDKEVY